ncbi:T9SS type A sorting domain-containing protein [Spirosoma sp. KCTC 42546]|uniref:T9SS type A sorting domain-containing protein n=1 Tax=Spirosoma sp. KCTC 42546 TaxID=2520506 RepID=UPI001157C9C5|nr:T9SS type A sorting domain-containing protein [Spirosoma sp. KCTC 42546]QDK78118.1 T9SS type A sorting domain-containing protein [Spirosoma sp. KCTC 42546]
MRTFLVLSLTFLGIQLAQATHLIGGYIQAKAASGSSLTYEITVTLYSYIGPATTEASSISVCFGDGNTATVTRASLVNVPLGSNNISSGIGINTYRINHTYAGPGVYTLMTSLTNRTPAVNVLNSTVQQEPLALTTTFTTVSAANQTPSLSIPTTGLYIPINQKITLPLHAIDVDGDSLVYGLAKSQTNTMSDFCNYRQMSTYQFPNDATHQGTYKLNSRTGDLTWDAPTKLGNYTIVISISEYRNGVLLSQTAQEIMVIVADLPGTPSTIPAYEPAIEGNGIITAIPNYIDSDMVLTAFPSPVEDRLQVVIQTSNPTTATLQLLDINGRNVHEQTFNRASREHEQSINMTSLAPGTYLVRAMVGGRSLLRKIVKR